MTLLLNLAAIVSSHEYQHQWQLWHGVKRNRRSDSADKNAPLQMVTLRSLRWLTARPGPSGIWRARHSFTLPLTAAAGFHHHALSVRFISVTYSTFNCGTFSWQNFVGFYPLKVHLGYEAHRMATD